MRKYDEAESTYKKALKLIPETPNVKLLNNICRLNLQVVCAKFVIKVTIIVLLSQIQPAMHGRFDVTHEQRVAGFHNGKVNCKEAVSADPNDAEANMNVCQHDHERATPMKKIFASPDGDTLQRCPRFYNSNQVDEEGIQIGSNEYRHQRQSCDDDVSVGWNYDYMFTHAH